MDRGNWSSEEIERLLGELRAENRAGKNEELGPLLNCFREYLLLIANQELADEVRPKVSPSDVVQETFLRAVVGFDQFRGSSEPELRVWLRQILINRLRDDRRHYGAEKRAVHREWDRGGTDSNASVQIPADDTSPSGALAKAELNHDLAAAIAQLPEAYRQVIVLRNFERRSFAEIGAAMDRSEDAACKLWVRAVDMLGEILGGSTDDT